MANDKIILIIPAHNNLDGLLASLRSLKSGTIQPDVLVIDDGSNPAIQIDETEFPNVTIIRFDTNQKIVTALNAGLNYALDHNYSFIARLDAGDLVINDRFRKQLDFLNEHKEIGIVGSWVQTFDAETGDDLFILKHPATDTAIRQRMFLNSCINHPSAMMRTSIVKLAGFYDERFRSAAQDYDYFRRILQIAQGANIPEPLLRYEMNNKQAISHKKRYTQLKNRLIIQLNFFEFLNIYSYIGIVKTLITLFIPYSFLQKVKLSILEKE